MFYVSSLLYRSWSLKAITHWLTHLRPDDLRPKLLLISLDCALLSIYQTFHYTITQTTNCFFCTPLAPLHNWFHDWNRKWSFFKPRRVWKIYIYKNKIAWSSINTHNSIASKADENERTEWIHEFKTVHYCDFLAVNFFVNEINSFLRIQNRSASPFWSAFLRQLSNSHCFRTPAR